MTKIPPPYKHQKQSIKFMKPRDRVFDASDPGTGKTRVELQDFVDNREPGKKMLVLAPRSILRNAWGNDVAKFTPDLRVSIANADNRAEAFAQDADIYITNLDAIKWVAKQPKDFFKRFERIVIDESSAFKHPNSQRSKALIAVAERFPIRRNMTGTPNTRSITDIWNQVYFLTKDWGSDAPLGHSFYAFRNSVSTPEQVGRKAEMVRWIDKPGAEEAVYAAIKDFVIRHKFEECVDIPPTSLQEITYYQTKKQQRAYEDMQKDAFAMLNETSYLTAVNAAAVRTKLLQIASGAVYTSKDSYHMIDDGRYELVADLVEARKHTIVFYLWKHQRDELIREAQARGISYCVFDGEASDAQRAEYERLFQAGFYQLMIAHPKSAAHGLTLTRATTTLWPSPPDDLEWWVQGNRRHARSGQTQKTEVIVILAEDTIEMGIYHVNLKKKLASMTNLLELMEYKHP